MYKRSAYDKHCRPDTAYPELITEYCVFIFSCFPTSFAKDTSEYFRPKRFWSKSKLDERREAIRSAPINLIKHSSMCARTKCCRRWDAYLQTTQPFYQIICMKYEKPFIRHKKTNWLALHTSWLNSNAICCKSIWLTSFSSFPLIESFQLVNRHFDLIPQ